MADPYVFDSDELAGIAEVTRILHQAFTDTPLGHDGLWLDIDAKVRTSDGSDTVVGRFVVSDWVGFTTEVQQ